MQEQILTIEQIMLHAMPAEKDLQVGDWKLRLNGRYTYRANCVCPFHYMKTEQTVQKISLCEKIFYQNRIPAVFKVTPVRQPGLAELLTARDYQKVKTVHVMAASLNMMSAGRSADIYVQSRPSEEWISASLALSGVWESHMAALHSQMICRIAVPAVFVRAERNGKIVGCGYGAFEEGYAGIYDLHVLPQYRKQGIATAICRTILACGYHNGAEVGYLIVHSKNQNAISLYAHLKFTKLYEYAFYQKPSVYTIVDA